jgi:sugar phosphate permease
MYYGWWMVILLFYTLINTAGTHFYSFSVYVPRLIEEFDCTTSSLMLTAAAWSIVFGFSNPVVGSLVHRHGVRRIFITGVVINGVLMLLMS